MKYSIGKPGRPFVAFVDTIESEKLHRLDFFPNSSYENERAYRYFTDFYAKEISNMEIKKKIKQYNFNSNICHSVPCAFLPERGRLKDLKGEGGEGGGLEKVSIFQEGNFF